jgi:hypothetical protein
LLETAASAFNIECFQRAVENPASGSSWIQGSEMKIQVEIDEYPQLRHAIKTLEIERSRLAKLIREPRSVSETRPDGPEPRINELKICLDEVKAAISLIHDCVEAARHGRQREYPVLKENAKTRRSK